MPERPLLILPVPGTPAQRSKKTGGGRKPHFPTRGRQDERLTPKFSVLQEVFDDHRTRLRTEAAGLIPEEVIVLETVGSVENFIVAIRNIEGLEWLGEIEEEDIPPDDDFFVQDKQGIAQSKKTLRGRVFMVFTNQQALQQLFSLWNLWKSGQQLPRGLKKWGNLFFQLRDVRLWGVRDRLLETGILEDWRERVEHNEELIPCEIELWFRNDHRRRQDARERVNAIIQELRGTVRNEIVIEEIAYHVMLAQLPIGSVRTFLEEAGHESSLVQCEQIQFFRATGQMAGIIVEDERSIDSGEIEEPTAPLGEPVIALFDGLPLQNHRRLAGRLIVDDPDNYESQYPAADRRHGTAMASLILHGDLSVGESPLTRRLYVRPIMRPDIRDWQQPSQETVSDDTLVVDLVHRAVRRIFEGDGNEPATAPQICVINISVGIRDRLFEGAMSPFARLLDWLAWKYQVLFIISAGNHDCSIELDVPRGQISTLTPNEIQTHVVKALASDTRHRRLLSPAEAMNVVTVGAIHHDSSADFTIPRSLKPYINEGLPSVINAQGMGYRRAIKPDVLLSGGRVLFLESLQQSSNTILDIYRQSKPPGHKVAAPGTTPGNLASTWYSRGTSNATALASRATSHLYDVLKDLRSDPGGELIDEVPFAVWLKTLLIHSASWGEAINILEQILRTPENSRQFKEYITRLIGYGNVESERVSKCTEYRVTALGGGLLQKDQAHIHRFPLPPSLSGKRGKRRLIITLAWLTPVNTMHQGWRRAHLWFTPPLDPLKVTRQEVSWQAVQRGTVQHELMEGEKAATFVDGDNIEIQVSCRSDAGTLEEEIPYALATTVEVAEEIGIDIYNEVSVRVHAARVRIASSE